MRTNTTKLLPLAVTLLAIAPAWWTGCSSNDETSGPGADAGGTPEASSGGQPEGGGNTDGSTTDGSVKDTAADSPPGLPFIDIAYGAANCPAFTPCGGDPVGSWKVSGGCVTEEVLAPAKQQCAGLVESDVKFRARGTVVTTATTVTRNTDVEYTAKLAVPPECKPTMPPFNTCASVGQGLVLLAGLDMATCTDDAVTGGCNCTVADSYSDGTVDAYTTSGNTLTTGAAGSERTFDYCVNGAGNELTYQETTAKALPAILVLTK